MTEVATRSEEVRAFYAQTFHRLEALRASAQETAIAAIHAAGLTVHQINSRTKSLEGLIDKACRRDDRDPSGFRYADPTHEITDLVGIRIIVPLADDVHPIANAIRPAFHLEEEVDRGNEPDIAVPGYRSRHLVVRMRDDSEAVQRDRFLMIETSIEIQVRSLLQHAMASFEHDLIYKSERRPAARIKRRFATLAALLEVTDREFTQVRKEHLSEAEEIGTEEVDDDQTSPVSDKQVIGSGRLTHAQLSATVQEMTGYDLEDPEPWIRELQSVLTDLGIQDVESLKARLSTTRQDITALAAHLTARDPWTTSSKIIDLALRLSLDQEYSRSRSHTIKDGDLKMAEQTFQHQRQEALEILGASQ